MESNRHRLGVAALVLLLVAGAATFALGRAAHSMSLQVGAVLAALALGILLLVLRP